MAITDAKAAGIDIKTGITIKAVITTRAITITHQEPDTMTTATTPDIDLGTIAATTIATAIITMATIALLLGTQVATIETAAATRTVITTTAIRLNI